MELNIPDIIIQLAQFLSNLTDFIHEILFYQFEIFGVNVNMLSMLFVVGVGTWITIIIIRLII